MILAEAGLTVSDMLNRSKGENAYTMLDVDHCVSDAVVEQLKSIEGVLRVRLIPGV